MKYLLDFSRTGSLYLLSWKINLYKSQTKGAKNIWRQATSIKYNFPNIQFIWNSNKITIFVMWKLKSVHNHNLTELYSNISHVYQGSNQTERVQSEQREVKGKTQVLDRVTSLYCYCLNMYYVTTWCSIHVVVVNYTYVAWLRWNLDIWDCWFMRFIYNIYVASIYL